MSLYHKHRPQTLDDVVGNKETVEALRADLSKPEPPHAFLFSGPTGCGKTTLGRIVASILGSKGTDFQEIDSADFRGIDTVREIRRQTQFLPLESPCRVWLIDEVHKMTNDAQNAMLKGLEDAPPHVFFVLATTEPQKLLPTIRGRCAHYPVNPLNETQTLWLLRRTVKAEGASLSKAVYSQIVQDSEGLPRNALQILDQVLAVPEETRLEIAKRSGEQQSQTIELCRALLGGFGWAKVRNILNGLREEDPEKIRRAVLGYCNSVLLKGENIRAGWIMEQMLEPFYNTGWPGLTFACYSIVNGGPEGEPF